MQQQLGVLVDEGLMKKIDDYRKERHFSRSDVVRLALLDMLNGGNHDEPEQQPQADQEPKP